MNRTIWSAILAAATAFLWFEPFVFLANGFFQNGSHLGQHAYIIIAAAPIAALAMMMKQPLISMISAYLAFGTAAMYAIIFIGNHQSIGYGLVGILAATAIQLAAGIDSAKKWVVILTLLPSRLIMVTLALCAGPAVSKQFELWESFVLLVIVSAVQEFACNLHKEQAPSTGA